MYTIGVSSMTLEEYQREYVVNGYFIPLESLEEIRDELA